jgi:hypothetical protein
MKERANAVLFTTIALVLVAWWVWPKPYMPIGDLGNRCVVAVRLRDVSGACFRSTDSLFLSQLVHALDRTERIPEVMGRQSKGAIDMTLELSDAEPIQLRVICHDELGPVIHAPGDFAGASLDSVMMALQRAFPEGRWCSPRPFRSTAPR